MGDFQKVAARLAVSFACWSVWQPCFDESSTVKESPSQAATRQDSQTAAHDSGDEAKRSERRGCGGGGRPGRGCASCHQQGQGLRGAKLRRQLPGDSTRLCLGSGARVFCDCAFALNSWARASCRRLHARNCAQDACRRGEQRRAQLSPLQQVRLKQIVHNKASTALYAAAATTSAPLASREEDSFAFLATMWQLARF